MTYTYTTHDGGRIFFQKPNGFPVCGVLEVVTREKIAKERGER
jgi:hypothetical protein